MNDLDNAFKNPERYAISDASFDRLLEARAAEKRQANALIAFVTLVGGVVAIVVTAILAVNGVFGG